MKRPGKIICVGRNYAAHARELGNEVPEEPLLFLKPPSAIVDHGGAIIIPRASAQVEHEAEIGVVVGSRLHHASLDEAEAAIAGVTCLNDVTARDLQRRDRQWTRAKGFDTFCPLGPTVVPVAAAEIPHLEIIGRVNGQVRQHGYARDMVFPVPALLSYISAIMSLEPGDVVATGTPEGVGPLAPGDVVDVEIPGVGLLSNPVRAA